MSTGTMPGGGGNGSVGMAATGLAAGNTSRDYNGVRKR